MLRWQVAVGLMANLRTFRGLRISQTKRFTESRSVLVPLDSHNNMSRYFTTTKALWIFQRSNQDKEKLKNYIFLGGIAGGLLFVLYMNLTMEYHQDYVYIEPDEEEKKK